MIRMRSKYGSRKVEFSGLRFDSQAEARRWGELLILERMGKIGSLRRQVALELVPGVKLHGARRARPAIRLIVDFSYRLPDGQLVYEDTKGFETPQSLLKRHLAKALHGIDVRLTGFIAPSGYERG